MGITEPAIEKIAASRRLTTINALREIASDSGPVKNRPNAKANVDADSTRLLLAAFMPKLRDNTGISGCTQYSSAKVANPPDDKAKDVRQNAGVPRAIWVGIAASGGTKGTSLGMVGRGAERRGGWEGELVLKTGGN